MFEITLPFTIMFEMHYHGENDLYKHITREDINKRDMFPLPPYKPSVSLEILHLKTYFPPSNIGGKIPWGEKIEFPPTPVGGAYVCKVTFKHLSQPL